MGSQPGLLGIAAQGGSQRPRDTEIRPIWTGFSMLFTLRLSVALYGVFLFPGINIPGHPEKPLRRPLISSE
jgi:hypothetical protein